MGKVNMKLMQGIEAIEGQVKKDQEIQEQDNVSGREVNVEVSEKSSDKAENISEILPESRTESSKVSEKTKKETVHVNSRKVKSSLNETPQKQVFSFRTTLSDINFWKTYARACGKTMESIGTEAMNEYMKRHKLSEAELAVFNALLAKNADK